MQLELPEQPKPMPWVCGVGLTAFLVVANLSSGAGVRCSGGGGGGSGGGDGGGGAGYWELTMFQHEHSSTKLLKKHFIVY